MIHIKLEAACVLREALPWGRDQCSCHSPRGSCTGWAGSYPRARLGTATQPWLPSAWYHRSRNWLQLELSLLSSQPLSHQIAFNRLTALPVRHQALASDPWVCLDSVSPGTGSSQNTLCLPLPLHWHFHTSSCEEHDSKIFVIYDRCAQ